MYTHVYTYITLRAEILRVSGRNRDPTNNNPVCLFILIIICNIYIYIYTRTLVH